MSDRIPCINPNCRSTADASKYEEGVEIVCRKCWRKLPSHLTGRYRQLRQRGKKIARLTKKRATGALGTQFATVLLDRATDANWRQIKSYFTAPPAPAGIENFMKEIGIV